MRYFKTILLIAAAGALFTTACTNQRETPAPQKGEVLLQVASGVNGLRAYDKNWEANDEIGIFASTLSASNVKYTTPNAGASVKFTTTERVVVPAGTTQHDIKSYYPYKEGVTTEVEVALPATKPLLYSTGQVTYDNPTVSLVFNHKLAELKVVISDLEDQKGVTKVELKGLKSVAKLNVETGNVTSETEKDATLHAFATETKAAEHKYVFHGFIAAGENLVGKELIITAGDGRVYKTTLKAGEGASTATASVAGTRYVYTFKLSGGQLLNPDNSTIGATTEESIDGGSISPEAGATTTSPITIGGAGITGVAGAQTLSVAQAGGSQVIEVNVASGQKFTATASEAWVTLHQPTTRTAVEGTGPSNLQIEVQANEGEQAREATVTIASEGVESVSFTIKQEGKPAAPAVQAPSQLFMIGKQFGAWQWGEGVVEMTPVNGDATKFWTVRYFEAGKENGFKWNSAKAWDSNEFNQLETSEGFATAEGNAYVENAGFYAVLVDYTAKKITIKEAKLYGAGAAFGGDEALRNPANLFKAENQTLVGTTTHDGELRLFADVVEGGEWWKTEFIILNGKIVYRGNGADQERVQVKAGQKVVLDLNASTGTIEGVATPAPQPGNTGGEEEGDPSTPAEGGADSGEPAPTPGGETGVVSQPNDGSEARPFTVSEAIANQGKSDVWVVGYILGSTGDGTSVLSSSRATNLLVGETNDATGGAVIPVELPSKTAVRTDWNVKDNPTQVGKKVLIKGRVTPYFGTSGIKDTKEIKLAE